MLSAAVDVGSNTLRIIIGSITDNKLSRIYTDRAITRLAQEIEETGKLSEENITKSISVLKKFSQAISRYGADHIRAVGTSAIREAENSNEFIDRAFKAAGILIEPISGIREAELTIKGVLLGFKDINQPSIIIDIGGGSTEWIAHDSKSANNPILSGTIPIGSVNLHERFIKTDPPSQGDISAMNSEIKAMLEQGILKRVQNDSFRVRDIIGTGGTITTLASLDLKLAAYDPEKVQMHGVPIGKLYRIKDMLVSLPLRERANITGLEPGRADLIIPGIMLTIKLLELFKCDEITVSDYGLLEGILKEISDEKGL